MALIPGLPKDLGMQCLTRVPYRFHVKLRAVSKSFNALLNCAHFYKERQRHEEREEGVVSLHTSGRTLRDFDVIIFYPFGLFWERLPEIPREFELEYTAYHRSVFSNQQLVVMGLLNTCSDTECVLIFDFLSRRWRLGADMPFSRCYFACAASPSEGLVYIGGGCHRPNRKTRRNRGLSRPLLEGFVYNVEENKWDSLPPMNSEPLLDLCVGVFLDDKFYVVPRESTRAQVYDPHTRLWKCINTDDNAQYIHSCIDATWDFSWFTNKDRVRAWIDVKDFDIDSNSATHEGYGSVYFNKFPEQRYVVYAGAVACSDHVFVSVVDSNNCVKYYSLDPREEDKKSRWSPVSGNMDDFVFSSVSVQI